MTQVPFATENRKKANNFNYPRLKLSAGERARIAIIDEVPTASFVHNLESVIVDDFGSPVMEEIKFKNGGTKMVPTYHFVAAYRCTGVYKTVEATGADPEGCAMCAAAADPDTAAAFKAPHRKFAIHVLRYKLNPNSTKVQDPFQVELEAWVFPNGKYDRLVDIATEHGPLMNRDLLLGPCENELYQKWDIQPGGGSAPEWTTADDRKKLVAQLLANRCEDLPSLIARLGSPADIALSMREVTSAWETAFPKPSVTNNVIAEARAAQVQASPITGDNVVAEFLKGNPVEDEPEEEVEEVEDAEGVDIAAILDQFKNA